MFWFYLSVRCVSGKLFGYYFWGILNIVYMVWDRFDNLVSCLFNVIVEGKRDNVNDYSLY